MPLVARIHNGRRLLRPYRRACYRGQLARHERQPSYYLRPTPLALDLPLALYLLVALFPLHEVATPNPIVARPKVRLWHISLHTRLAIWDVLALQQTATNFRFSATGSWSVTITAPQTGSVGLLIYTSGTTVGAITWPTNETWTAYIADNSNGNSGNSFASARWAPLAASGTTRAVSCVTAGSDQSLIFYEITGANTTNPIGVNNAVTYDGFIAVGSQPFTTLTGTAGATSMAVIWYRLNNGGAASTGNPSGYGSDVPDAANWNHTWSKIGIATNETPGNCSFGGGAFYASHHEVEVVAAASGTTMPRQPYFVRQSIMRPSHR